MIPPHTHTALLFFSLSLTLRCVFVHVCLMCLRCRSGERQQPRQVPSFGKAQTKIGGNSSSGARAKVSFPKQACEEWRN